MVSLSDNGGADSDCPGGAMHDATLTRSHGSFGPEMHEASLGASAALYAGGRIGIASAPTGGTPMTPPPMVTGHFRDDARPCRGRHSHYPQACSTAGAYYDCGCRGYLALVDLLAGLVLFLIIVAATMALPAH